MPGSQQPLASLGNAQFTASALTRTDQMKQDAVQKVPEGASVASDLSILTQLIPGRTVYWIGHDGEPAPDYVVIDRMSNSWGGNRRPTPHSMRLTATATLREVRDRWHD